MKRSKVVIEDYLGLEPDEELLILDDGTLDKKLIDSFVAAAFDAGAKTQVLSYLPTQYFTIEQAALAASATMKGHTVETTKAMQGALMGADCIATLTSDNTILFAKVFKKMQNAHKRVVTLPYLTISSFIRLMPSSSKEAEDLRARCRVAAKLLAGRHKVRITSTEGTDFNMTIGDIPVKGGEGGYIGKEGGKASLPTGMIQAFPNYGTTEGKFVADFCIAAPRIKELHEPITVVASKGKVVDIQGGQEAWELRHFIEELDDPNLSHLTELGLGVNPKAKFPAIGLTPMNEDTRIPGVINMAMGSDIHYGGTVRAKAHIDMTLRRGKLMVDDKVIVEDRKLLFPLPS